MFGNLIKRAFDVVAAVAGLLVASPLFLTCAAAIKLDDRGPVLFRQVRVGRGGRRFRIVKFRTMVVDAELSGAGVRANDDRVTRVGRVLRKTSLDELPQLWNILRGDMAIVGPRPTLPYQVEQYTAEQHRRHEVRPGITGWAQIKGRTSIPWADRIVLDLWYVDNRSTGLDLRIIAATIGTVFRDRHGFDVLGTTPAHISTDREAGPA